MAAHITTADGLDTPGRIARKPRNRRPALTAEARRAAHDRRRRELGVTDELAAVPGISPVMLIALGEAGILAVDELADCATDDLSGVLGRRVGAAKAGQIIMSARRAAGWLDEDDDNEATVPLGDLVMHLFDETAREDSQGNDEIDYPYPCPCCSNALPELPVVTSPARVTPMQACILTAVWRGKGHGVMSEKIFGTMFADDADGGP